jgi:PAS domain S-box-containing protein
MGGNVHEADVSPNTPLEDSSIRLATAIDEVNIGVLARNPAGRITYANAKILEWLGYERGELVGKPITNLVPKEFRDLLLEEMKAAEQGDTRARLYVMQRKDYTTLPVITLPKRFLKENGEYDGSVVIVVDLGIVQTAKPLGSAGEDDMRARLGRIALELQSISLTADLPTSNPVPLEHPELEAFSPREAEVLTHLVAGSRVPPSRTSCTSASTRFAIT